MKIRKIHIGWVLTFVLSYMLIEVVSNYNYFFGILDKFLNVLAPFIMGLVLAYMLSPIVELLEKKFKMNRFFSLLIVYGVIIIINVGILLWVIPLASSSVVDIAANVPSYADKMDGWINNQVLDMNPAIVETVRERILSLIPKMSDLIKVLLSNVLDTTISLTMLVVNLVFAMVISLYLLADKEKFTEYCKKVLFVACKPKKAETVMKVLKTFDDNIGTYIVAKCIDSFCVGVVSFIGLSLLGSKYALLLGIFCGLTNMIPYFGPFLGMIPVFIVNIFYSLGVTIACLIFLNILQQIEGNIIEPKFVGGKLGLNPLLTLLAVTVGGGFFGIMGMIVSVPIMGVIKIYFDEMIHRYSYREKVEEKLEV